MKTPKKLEPTGCEKCDEIRRYLKKVYLKGERGGLQCSACKKVWVTPW